MVCGQLNQNSSRSVTLHDGIPRNLLTIVTRRVSVELSRTEIYLDAFRQSWCSAAERYDLYLTTNCTAECGTTSDVTIPGNVTSSISELVTDLSKVIPGACYLVHCNWNSHCDAFLDSRCCTDPRNTNDATRHIKNKLTRLIRQLRVIGAGRPEVTLPDQPCTSQWNPDNAGRRICSLLNRVRGVINGFRHRY